MFIGLLGCAKYKLLHEKSFITTEKNMYQMYRSLMKSDKNMYQMFIGAWPTWMCKVQTIT